MIIKHGEVYKFRVSSKKTEGTEQQKDRPAVIILYPTELVIKKKDPEKEESRNLEDYEKELEEYEKSSQKEENFMPNFYFSKG